MIVKAFEVAPVGGEMICIIAEYSEQATNMGAKFAGDYAAWSTMWGLPEAA